MAETTLIATSTGTPSSPTGAAKDRRVAARLILVALFLILGAAWGVGLTLLA